ncbi:hypothetical protein BJ878DRAFT_506442 [Calycina marina]|uniref:Uncharacterized protein n=1 Tax=Calycina marina TaxID=1763456 RepID=A0A9P7Z311_9HELO|nr:hypothetical protein BJ878DRAFT_506442 [Calycina marina]
MGVSNSVLNVLTYLIPFAGLASAHGKFDQCLATIAEIMNGTKNNTYGWNEAIHLYNGTIRGFDESTGEKKPLTLTYEGCKLMCNGNVPDPNDVFTALSVLTTWVLPSVALFSNLPYEALSKKKIRKTFEAFTSWIGSPQTALTTTLFNIHVMRRCQIMSKKEPQTELNYRDVLYILSCVGQYEYRTFGTRRSTVISNIRDRRDRALVYGILTPLENTNERDVIYTRVIAQNLAFQLRCNRRRGVFPVLINVAWFIVAFAFSLVTAFANLGDNTTAHSLALGIFVAWLPVLICSTIMDRNPTASTRCRVLIDRWLYQCEQISNCPQGSEPAWWEPPNRQMNLPGSDMDMTVGDYIGQGRRLRYCGVTNALLEIVEKYAPSDSGRASRSQRFQDYQRAMTLEFTRTLTRRPASWWIICGVAHLFVIQQNFLAFVVSFQTPTIGLGCRSALFLGYFLVSLITSSIQLCFQEPPPWTRRITVSANTFNTLLLLVIMMLQVIGGLNNCYCKTSQIGTKRYGGYTDLENAQFYKTAFHVVKTWATAAAFGLSGCLLLITWNLKCWAKTSPLWTNNEDPHYGPDQDDRVDMKWLT